VYLFVVLLENSGSDGITEEAVRRYLMRKPMTTKELVHKFKSRNAGMTKEQMTMTIAQILKRLNPLQKKVNGIMTLYLKPETK
jgi:transcription initiation factor TFIIF subunit alpha